MADPVELLQFWSEPEDRFGKLTVWDTILLDGKVFPNADSLDDAKACKVTVKATRALVTDKIKPHAASATSLIYKGFKAAQLELRVHVWRIEQYRALLNMFPKINPSAKITKTVKKVAATTVARPPVPSFVGVPVETKTVEQIPSHTIEHPDLQALGITQIIITEIGTPEEGEPGERIYPIKAMEIVKAKKGDKDVTKKVADTNVDTSTPLAKGFELDGKP